jgi:tRNA(adenine34) deaminase
MLPDEYYMKLALGEARMAFEEDEVPVGAVVVMNDRVIARGHNMMEKLNDPTAHAEMIALTSAFNHLGGKYLQDATLYVTVEPCLMCTGALYWSKIGRVVWGAPDEKNGHARVTGSHFPFHPKTLVAKGVMADECASLMKEFFRSKR